MYLSNELFLRLGVKTIRVTTNSERKPATALTPYHVVHSGIMASFGNASAMVA
jgi:hypothetical protein